MTPVPLRSRGFTLVEMMVALAVMSVIVLAAVLSASSIFSLTQGQARRSSAEAALALATVSLEKLASNAGAGFPNARYAVRVRNNVTTTTTLSGNLPVVVAGGPVAGVIAGTDVLELSWGNPQFRRAGAVAPAPTGSQVVVTFGTVALNSILTGGDPLADEEWGGAQPATPRVLLITRTQDPLESCLFSFGSPLTLPVIPVDQVLTERYGVATSSCVVTSPIGVADTLAYKLEGRVRLFVYQQANGVDLGLYRQNMDTSAVSIGDFENVTVAGQEPEAVALGVENLQLAPVLGPNVDGGFPAVGSCSTSFCRCADGADGGMACNLDENGVYLSALPSVASLLRAIDAEVTVIGDRRPGERRPASFDSPAAATPDDRRRALAHVSINVNNCYLFAQ